MNMLLSFGSSLIAVAVQSGTTRRDAAGSSESRQYQKFSSSTNQRRCHVRDVTLSLSSKTHFLSSAPCSRAAPYVEPTAAPLSISRDSCCSRNASDCSLLATSSLRPRTPRFWFSENEAQSLFLSPTSPRPTSLPSRGASVSFAAACFASSVAPWLCLRWKWFHARRMLLVWLQMTMLMT